MGQRTLQVPEEVHQKWRSGNRAELLKALQDANLNKDLGFYSEYVLYSSKSHIPWDYQRWPLKTIYYHLQYHRPKQTVCEVNIFQRLWQEEFVRLVQIQEENKQQVKYKCWAGWASEDKMRDVLKIKE